jgi:hypothetical protein
MAPAASTDTPKRLLADIRSDLAEVDRICIDWEDGAPPDERESVDGLIERAFQSSLVLMETLGKSDTRDLLLDYLEDAQKNFSETEYSVNAMERYSVWSYRLGQILNAVEKVQFQLTSIIEEPLDLIVRVIERFPDVERALQIRREGRQTLTVKDEYDVQDLLRSLLYIFFDDISPEEPGAKFAGSSTRVDLLLRKEKIVVEIKKTRSSTTARALGKELKIDIVDYKQREDCDALVIMIHDREGRLPNPVGFVNDLMKVESGFRVVVRIV